MQLNRIFVGLIIVGFLAVGIASFLSIGATTYNINESQSIEFNNTFNKMNELSSQIEQFKDDETKKTDSTVFDVLGSFFTNMYQSAKVLRNSVGVMSDMADGTIEQLPTGTNSGVLKSAIGLIVIVIIFIGIFLHFVTKSERT